MKAMVLERIEPLRQSTLKMVETDIPKPGPHEIRIKVRCCAICRTDLHVIEGDLPIVKMPIIPGHQIIGVVEKCGPNAHRFDVGRRVGIAWLRRTCGKCTYCGSGRENLCQLAENSRSGRISHG